MALDDTDRIAIVNAIKEGFAASGKSSGFNSSGSGGGGATLDGKALQLAGGLLGSVFKDAANVVAKGGGRQRPRCLHPHDCGAGFMAVQDHEVRAEHHWAQHGLLCVCL